jgi:hypothetical protein
MSQQNVSRITEWTERINRMSRGGRIRLTLVITLVLTVLLSVVIDRTLIDRVVEGSVDPMLPALIAAGLGLVFYGVGWWAMVGFELNEPWRAGTPAVVFVVAGVAGLVLIIVLALFGLVFGYLL